MILKRLSTYLLHTNAMILKRLSTYLLHKEYNDSEYLQ